MNKGEGSKRGIFFTLDSVFAILILVTLFSVFMLLSVETVSTENMHQMLRFQAEDAVIVLAKTQLKDVRYLPVVQQMKASGTLVQIDDDYSIMEVVGALWATNESGNMTYAKQLITEVLGPSIPPNVQWAVTIGDETLYNTTNMSEARFMSTVSNRMVSGYMKGRPHVGYTAKAFLSNIKGKSESAYVFFGGFIGQGDITGVVRGIPADATVTGVYIEAQAGSNFALYINGTKCPSSNITVNESETGYLSWDLSAPPYDCRSLVKQGEDTKVLMRFESRNISYQYLGGGYIKVTYETPSMSMPVANKMRYYFPGVYGVLNVYDSFFVPGNVTEVNAWLRLSSEYSTYLNIGGVTIFNHTGSTDGSKDYIIDNASIGGNFTSPNFKFINISGTTVPLRLGTPALSFMAGGKPSDVILVTDVSGSMAWCTDQSERCCSPCETYDCLGGSENCSGVNPSEYCGYMSKLYYYNETPLCAKTAYGGSLMTDICPNDAQGNSTDKIEIAKRAEHSFVNRLLGGSLNTRIGAVAYSSSKTGYKILPDIAVTNFKITPNAVPVGTSAELMFNVTVTNEGFTPVINNFTVIVFDKTVLNNSLASTPITFVVQPIPTPLNPGASINLSVNRTLILTANTTFST